MSHVIKHRNAHKPNVNPGYVPHDSPSNHPASGVEVQKNASCPGGCARRKTLIQTTLNDLHDVRALPEMGLNGDHQ